MCLGTVLAWEEYSFIFYLYYDRNTPLRGYLMKKLLIILLVVTYSTISYSSCEKSYQIFTITNENTSPVNPRKQKAKKVISSGLGTVAGGWAVYATAFTLSNILGSSVKYAMLFTWGTSITVGSGISLSGTVSYLVALNYRKVQRSLKQSRVGLGVELAEMKANTEDIVGKEINMATFSKALNEANQSGVFCRPKNKLFKYEDIVDHMAKTLEI